MPPRFYTADDFRPLGTGFSYDSFNGSITFDCGNMQKEILEQVLGITNNTTKEIKKMEAKKCDRCGKLYEMPGACEDISTKVRFKHMYISGAEDMSGNKITEKQTKGIFIKTSGYDAETVDLCPDCRKSLKKWFESTDKEEKK